MSRAIYRLREHTLTPDTGPESDPWQYAMECKGCGQRGESTGSAEDGTAWAAEHLKANPGYLTTGRSSLPFTGSSRGRGRDGQYPPSSRLRSLSVARGHGARSRPFRVVADSARSGRAPPHRRREVRTMTGRPEFEFVKTAACRDARVNNCPAVAVNVPELLALCNTEDPDTIVVMTTLSGPI